jgi:hypothetical protein
MEEESPNKRQEEFKYYTEELYSILQDMQEEGWNNSDIVGLLEWLKISYFYTITRKYEQKSSEEEPCKTGFDYIG